MVRKNRAGHLLPAASCDELLVATNVSDMWSGLSLRGPGTRDVFAQAISLDLDRLIDGAATMTDVFEVSALVRRRVETFELWCDRSLTQHVRESASVAAGLQ